MLSSKNLFFNAAADGFILLCALSYHCRVFPFCLLIPSNLVSLLSSPWPIFLSLSRSLYLGYSRHQLSLSLMADGVWLLSWARLIHSRRSSEAVIFMQTLAATGTKGCLFVSHRMMKSAWSMCRPHLLCRRMPPLPTTAHFFKGSCRGLSWVEEITQLS